MGKSFTLRQTNKLAIAQQRYIEKPPLLVCDQHRLLLRLRLLSLGLSSAFGAPQAKPRRAAGKKGGGFNGVGNRHPQKQIQYGTKKPARFFYVWDKINLDNQIDTLTKIQVLSGHVQITIFKICTKIF
jgi:hypothetical protein